MDDKSVYDLSLADIRSDDVAKLRIFNAMLRALEDAGKCRYVFHLLAEVVTGDPCD